MPRAGRGCPGLPPGPPFAASGSGWRAVASHVEDPVLGFGERWDVVGVEVFHEKDVGVFEVGGPAALVVETDGAAHDAVGVARVAEGHLQGAAWPACPLVSRSARGWFWAAGPYRAHRAGFPSGSVQVRRAWTAMIWPASGAAAPQFRPQIASCRWSIRAWSTLTVSSYSMP